MNRAAWPLATTTAVRAAMALAAALGIAAMSAAPAAAQPAGDLAVGEPLPSVDLSGEPIALALDSEADRLYAVTIKTPWLAAVDLPSRSLAYEVRLPFLPAGVAVSERSHQVYVSEWMGATLAQFDGPSGELLKRLPVPASPAALAVDP